MSFSACALTRAPGTRRHAERERLSPAGGGANNTGSVGGGTSYDASPFRSQPAP